MEAGKKSFQAKFKSKTGQDFGPIFVHKGGKFYNCSVQNYSTQRTALTKWEYHLTHDPMGKPDGWYPYDGNVLVHASASANMEDYWQALQSNKHLSIRFVTSGNWTYKVDFSAMTQTNTTSNMCRPIRRVP